MPRRVVNGLVADLAERLIDEMDRPAAQPKRTPLALTELSRSLAVLADLRAADATPAEQVAAILGTITKDTKLLLKEPDPHTNWVATLGALHNGIGARLDQLAEGIVRDVTNTAAREQYSTHALTAPLLSELTELRAVQLVNWRQELRLCAEAELALIDAEMAVSL